MAKIKNMTERQVTKAYFDGKVTLKQYKERLVEIATSRHAKDISGRKYRSDMSSSGWKK